MLDEIMNPDPAAGPERGMEFGEYSLPLAVFAQVMQGALRMLGVPHDAPLEPLAVPGEGEEAKEST